MPTPPSSAPTSATVGDTLTWYQDAPDTTASDGWALAVTLQVGTVRVSATVTTVSGAFLVTFTPAQTATLAVGSAAWAARASKSGEVFTVASGTITLAANPATVTTTTTFNETMLAAIEAKLSGRLTDDIEKYGVAGRTVEKIPFDQLDAMRAKYQRLVNTDRRGGKMPPPIEYVLYAR